jgi:hypothetical protein
MHFFTPFISRSRQNIQYTRRNENLQKIKPSEAFATFIPVSSDILASPLDHYHVAASRSSPIALHFCLLHSRCTHTLTLSGERLSLLAFSPSCLQSHLVFGTNQFIHPSHEVEREKTRAFWFSEEEKVENKEV